ncbi:GntR family transcriptional regulator [Psychrobacillus sp. FJAT-51614]|uniref:GntR family transcriptional regulator n=1 Tax=Psychrobacillus mangrovi TaxID=3117745 RepID=A0ABU8F685_9BACI
MFEKAKRKSTSDIVYHEIRRKIVEWYFEPLEHLSEEQLVEQFAVSRTPLRQALYRLELEGLVIKASNGRIHVTDITLKHAKEIYCAREILEGTLAREASIRITQLELQQLNDKIHLMKLAASEQRIMDVVKYGTEFHDLIHHLSENETMMRFLEQIYHHINRYRRIGGKFNRYYDPNRPIREHEEIYKAFLTGNDDLVESVMREHIRNSYTTALLAIESYVPE